MADAANIMPNRKNFFGTVFALANIMPNRKNISAVFFRLICRY